MPALRPIKRSEQLAPLSREHHNALLFIWKIREGLKNGTPVSEIGKYVQWFWINFLHLHFDQEEHLLLTHLPETEEMGQRLRAEHQIIGDMIKAPLDVASLGRLADKMNDHIRFEERQVFPWIEQHLKPDQLNNIFRQLDQQPHCIEKWEDEFWLKK